MKKRIGVIVAVLGLLLWPLLLRAQTPDARGEVATTSSVHQGVEANAPVGTEHHIRNEGGSDRQGLCVICSAVINGSYQGVGDLNQLKLSRIWVAAKSRPGGYSPEKLHALIDEVYPHDEEMTYASYVGRDSTILEQLSNQGYPIGATMNTGQLYEYAPIHHMVSLIHYKQGQWACVVDNNDPGKYHWMPSTEFDRRWIDGGTGWAFVWTKLNDAGPSVALLLLATAVPIFLAAKLRKQSP